MGCAYAAVGMQRALDSAIGLPSRPTSASWILVFLMPAEVSRNFMIPLAALEPLTVICASTSLVFLRAFGRWSIAQEYTPFDYIEQMCDRII